MSITWDYQFCLVCDTRIDEADAAFCSESCRLADLEKQSHRDTKSSSGPSSPFLEWPTYEWRATQSVQNMARVWSLAYDHSHSQIITKPMTYPITAQKGQPSQVLYTNSLSPSVSYSSLASLGSTSSSSSVKIDTQKLAEQTTKELKGYARSFEVVNLQRRRSY